jgi:ATP-binding cassette subfamily F protein 3
LTPLCSGSWRVEQGRLIDYPGNYEGGSCEIQWRSVGSARARAFENQQTKFKQEQAFILRYKAGQRAKQARAGVRRDWKRAKNDSTLERPMELAAFNIELPKGAAYGRHGDRGEGRGQEIPP